MNVFSISTLKDLISFVSKKKITESNYEPYLATLKNLLMLLFLITAFLFSYFIIINNTLEEQGLWKSLKSVDWLAVSIGIPVMISFFIMYCGIQRLSKASLAKPYIEASDTNIRKIFFEKNEDAEKMINGYMNHFRDYEEFINNYEQLEPKGKKVELSEIAKKAITKVGAHFYCVISNPSYLETTESKISSLLGYFLTFHDAVDKNTITRIFTIPQSDNTYSSFDDVDRYSRIALLKYMLINDAVGVSTFLLIYQEDHNLNFVKSLDYVLLKSNDENTLYFSYETSTDKDKVIESNDNFLIKVIENDFYWRIKYLYNHSTDVVGYEFSSRNCEIILKVLNIKKQEYNNAIDDLCKQMSILVGIAKIPAKQEQLVVEQLKKVLMDRKIHKTNCRHKKT